SHLLLTYARVCCSCLFFFNFFSDPRDLHSFPTRRSSDLLRSNCPSAKGTTRVAWSSAASRGSERDTRLWLVRSRSRPSAKVPRTDRKSTRLNSSHLVISYAVFCLKKKKKLTTDLASQKLN